MYRKAAIYALSAVLITALCFSTAAASGEKKAAGADDWKFHSIVDVNFVKQYAKVPYPKGVTIIDSRPYKPKFIKGHIPTAVSMPFSKFDQMLDKLPKNKSDLLIFYCEGPT